MKLDVQPTDVVGAAELWGIASADYDVDRCYRKARRTNDPYLSPHGLFRRLAHGNNRHALEFLETFGPLRRNNWQVPRSMWEETLKQLPSETKKLMDSFPTIPTEPSVPPELRDVDELPDEYMDEFPEQLRQGVFPGDVIRVDLSEFWKRHKQFQLICQLYESLENPKALAETWEDYVRNWRITLPMITRKKAPAWFVNRDGPPALMMYFWSYSFPQRRREALAVISQAVNRFAGKSASWDFHGRALHLTMDGGGPLWQMIWEQFAFDTTGGPWRLCAFPGCGQIFYPPRVDRMCCTTRHQTLFSKRNYARKYRRIRKKRK